MAILGSLSLNKKGPRLDHNTSIDGGLHCDWLAAAVFCFG
jgi:hypothetical protein